MPSGIVRIDGTAAERMMFPFFCLTVIVPERIRICSFLAGWVWLPLAHPGSIEKAWQLLMSPVSARCSKGFTTKPLLSL